MANPEQIRAEAELLISKVKSATPEDVSKAIIVTMKQHYIRGGIDALESLLSSLPERLMDLPPQELKAISALISVMEEFERILKEKLHKSIEDHK